MSYDERPSRQDRADSCLGCLTAISFVLAVDLGVLLLVLAACGRL